MHSNRHYQYYDHPLLDLNYRAAHSCLICSPFVDCYFCFYHSRNFALNFIVISEYPFFNLDFLIYCVSFEF